MTMFLPLSSRDPRPLYQQISDQVREQILSGELQPGERLPSIRELAEQLTTSVITVRRAYADLEAEGYIYTRAGQGTFVSHRPQEAIRRQVMKDFARTMREVVRRGLARGLNGDDIREILERILEQGGIDGDA